MRRFARRVSVIAVLAALALPAPPADAAIPLALVAMFKQAFIKGMRDQVIGSVRDGAVNAAMTTAYRMAGKADPQARALVARVNTEAPWLPDKLREELIDGIETVAGMPAMPMMGGGMGLIPGMPAVPGMPSIPGMPSAAGIPSMPGMPSGADPALMARMNELARQMMPGGQLMPDLSQLPPEVRQQAEAMLQGRGAGGAGLFGPGGPKEMMFTQIGTMLDTLRDANTQGASIRPEDHDELVQMFTEQREGMGPQERADYATMLERGFMNFPPALRDRLVQAIR